jgi:drug/metabolite transporter (DMT)-like permease
MLSLLESHFKLEGQPLSVITLTGAAIILLGIWLLSGKTHAETTNHKGKLVLLGVVASLGTAVIWSISLTMMNIVVSSGVVGLDTNYAIVTLRIASIAVLLTVFSLLSIKDMAFSRLVRRSLFCYAQVVLSQTVLDGYL